jgi:carboxylesterase type B
MGSFKDWGAFHGSELAFVFGNFSFMGIKFGSKENSAIAKQVMSLWAAFARVGVPFTGKIREWPAYDIATEPYLEIGKDMLVGHKFKSERCRIYADMLGNFFSK